LFKLNTLLSCKLEESASSMLLLHQFSKKHSMILQTALQSTFRSTSLTINTGM